MSSLRDGSLSEAGFVSYPTPRPLLFHVHGYGFRCTRHVSLQRCHDMASPSLHGVPRDGSPASAILWDAPTPRRPSRPVRFLHGSLAGASREPRREPRGQTDLDISCGENSKSLFPKREGEWVPPEGWSAEPRFPVMTGSAGANAPRKPSFGETVATLPGDLGLLPIAEALKSATSRTGGKPNVIARGPEPCSPGISRARSRIGPGSLATFSFRNSL